MTEPIRVVCETSDFHVTWPDVAWLLGFLVVIIAGAFLLLRYTR